MERGEAVRPAGSPMIPMESLRPGGGGDPSPAGGAAEGAKDAGRELAGEARRAGTEVAQTARTRAQDEMDRRSTEAGERVASAAGDIRDVAGELRRKGRDRPADLAESAADRVERFAAYLKESDAETIIADARDLGRRQPAVLVAGAAVLGIVAGRMVKAAAPAAREEVRR
jgi:hypothetical protein